MNQHTWRVLEVEKIVAKLASQAVTQWYAQELRANLENQFYQTPEEALRVMEEARYVAMLDENPGFATPRLLEDFSPVLEKLKVLGHVLGQEDLSLLLPALAEADHFVSFGNPEYLLDLYSITNDEAQGFSKLFQGLGSTKEILKVLFVYFDPQGNLKEDKIPELLRLKREIQSANQELMVQAKRALGSSPDMYSSDTPVYRDGRVLLPLKADYKGKIDGVIYGSSDSGQTLYVESRELLAKNNTLFQSNAAYIREVHRIFRQVTEKLREYQTFLEFLFQFWSYFDVLWVRARWMKDHGAQIPTFSDSIFLPKARHPLLGRSVVPLDLVFKDPLRLLVLTGPNTGGKTVALKTLGLFGVLAQLAIPLPTGENPEIPWFSGVYADIGDEQSIEHQLSTFSAHIKNTAEVLQFLDQGSLVLLDELGTGTDPLEGGALAVAVLEELAKKACYGLVTSHHSSVKAYAFSHSTMENAAMEFDTESKAPSYRILYGLPGESRALDIAQRVGFPAAILDRARILVGDQSSSIDSLLSGILEKDQRLNKQLSELQEEKKAIELTRAQLSVQESQLLEKKETILAQAISEADEFLAQTRRSIENAIQEFYSDVAGLKERIISLDLESQETHLQEMTKNISNSLRAVTKLESEKIFAIKNNNQKIPSKSSIPLEPGMEVRIQGSAQRGTLVQKQRSGKWLVQAGMIKLTVQEDLLDPVNLPEGPVGHSKSTKVRQPQKILVEYSKIQDSEIDKKANQAQESLGTPQFTLDVRGMRLEPAVKMVEEQIDKALVHGLTFFSIIHGKGTGVLQQGIHELLKSHNQVRSFSFARPEDGGFGKTLVEL